MRTIKLVLVGCGRQASSVLHTSLQFIDNVEIAGCCDMDRGRAEAASSRFSRCRSYTDLAKMLDSVEADAALVVSYPNIQGELVLKCLRAGLHVLTEKPLSLDLEQACQIAETARNNSLICRVSFNKRFAPAYKKLKAATENSVFGKVNSIYSKFAGGYRPATLDMLRVGAIHMFDLTRFLLGEYAELFAYAYEKQAGQASFTVNYRMKSGAVGIFLLSCLGLWSSKGSEYVEVRGDQNIFCVDSGRNAIWQKPPIGMESGTTTQSRIEIPSPFECFEPNYSDVGYLEMQTYYLNGFYDSIKAFVFDVMKNNLDSSPNSHDGIEALKVAMAIQKSCESGKPVSL